jgi:hypothetical protein
MLNCQLLLGMVNDPVVDIGRYNYASLMQKKKLRWMLLS